MGTLAKHVWKGPEDAHLQPQSHPVPKVSPEKGQGHTAGSICSIGCPHPSPTPCPVGDTKQSPALPLGDNGALDDGQQPLLPQHPGHGDGAAHGLPQPREGPGPHQVQAQGPDAALEAERLIDGEILLQAVVQLQRGEGAASVIPKCCFPYGTAAIPQNPELQL